MKIKFISTALAFSLCITLCSCQDKSSVPAVAVSDGVEADTYVYTGNGTSAWCSSLFETSAIEYNNKLALVAAEMSDASENDSGNDETIKALFSSYSLYACEYYNFDGTSPFSAGGAFAIGQDTLTIDGVNTTILIVAARGTKNLRETIGDWLKGGESDFLNTKVWHNAYEFEEKIWDGISEYIAKYPAIQSAEHLKILITGHSLGGAAANMVGARFTSGVENGEWWSDKVAKDDIYVYTFGAIKVLTTEENIVDGYENIHNIYNYFDSFGPNGSISIANASSPNAKFGHTELYSLDEDGGQISFNNHLNYKSALEIAESDASFIKLACEGQPTLQPGILVTESPTEIENVPADNDFVIEGTWKNVGATTFGQAQLKSIIVFDGTHCNYYSPYDTYVISYENGQCILECVSYVFAETLRFRVDIVDKDTIDIYYGSDAVRLTRIAQNAETIQEPEQPQQVDSDFAIEGSWLSVGSDGFGQAQPGMIVMFDGTHCNFFSPYDTYAFYQDNGQWKLDCTSFLFSETLTFNVEIIDGDYINVYYGSSCTELSRMG